MTTRYMDLGVEFDSTNNARQLAEGEYRVWAHGMSAIAGTLAQAARLVGFATAKLDSRAYAADHNGDTVRTDQAAVAAGGLPWSVATPEDRAAIRALRGEAGVAGDLEQVAVCDRALAGDEAALRECKRVVDDAHAQQDEDAGVQS